MTLTIEYWESKDETIVSESGFRYLDRTSVIKKTEKWSGNIEEIFRKFYQKNRQLMYCNESCYKFQNPEWANQYMNWYDSLGDRKTFQMYYGNGIVD